ncbi:alpha/beta fold hydrolase [Nocardioides marmorisolisilvae]|uniref:Alpha/beta hydrolase n=1 Tax=Nocardioides marmorisolisilvae TaxID=1542737 RepID=A0A3N0DTS8_9ACTN|nr:alpha/beta hydrolase [Nocardioides marmorisolisilvae]RNL79035.1 alpha/beta hydrolase [Nocardioides marmorisolisilvae]
MSTVRLGADELWYDEIGGEGTPLVLLHPGVTDSRIWDPMLSFLVGRQVIRFDRRGYGRSPRATEPHSGLGDLVGLLDALGIEKAHLVGNSMGGETSLALAVTAPQRVASLTLLCPGIGGYPWEDGAEDPEVEAAWATAKDANDIPAMAAVLGRVWFASGSDDYLDEQILAATTLDYGPGESFEQDNPEQWDLVDRISVPTAIVAADLDPADSLKASIDLAAKIPGSVLVRLAADHVPQYREPEAVAEVVLATVDRAI